MIGGKVESPRGAALAAVVVAWGWEAWVGVPGGLNWAAASTGGQEAARDGPLAEAVG